MHIDQSAPTNNTRLYNDIDLANDNQIHCSLFHCLGYYADRLLANFNTMY